MKNVLFVPNTQTEVKRGRIKFLITDLERWAKKRHDKNLDARPLEHSIVFLNEYIQLLEERDLAK